MTEIQSMPKTVPSQSRPAPSRSAAAKLTTPKLRASCDGCHLAKVKCTKERPLCARCLSTGIGCRYSPSRRAGKPRKAREQQQQTKTTALKSGVTGILEESWDNEIVPGLMLRDVLHTTTSVPDLEGNPQYPIDGWACKINPQWQDPTADYSDESLASSARLSPSILPSSVSPPWTATGDSPLIYPFEQDAGMHVNHFDAMFQQTESFSTDAFMPTMKSCPETPWLGHGQEHHVLLDTKMADNSPGACNCFAAVIVALFNLQSRFEEPTTTMDISLVANRDAIDQCTNSLKCSCAKDSTSIMLLAAVIGKILSFYQKASRMAQRWASSPASPEASQNVGISAARMKLGSYKMGEQDDVRLKLNMFLIELTKVEALLARFREEVASIPVELDSSTCETLVSFLTQRLRATTATLQAKILEID